MQIRNYSENSIDVNDKEVALWGIRGEHKIYCDKGDPEIASLHEKWRSKKLDLQPPFQRKYIWDEKKASRLIESVLLRVPLPLFYIAEAGDGKEQVIDGQQRLTSFFSFIDGTFPSGKPFRLSGCTIYAHLNGLSFAELSSDLQDAIRYYNVRTITVLRESHPDLKFEIFERINTGSAPLTETEVRNCVYRGPYLDLVHEFSNDPSFIHISRLLSDDMEMRRMEMILRFCAFQHTSYHDYRPPLRQFINHDLMVHQMISEVEADRLRSAFTCAIENISAVFGDHGFTRFIGGKKSDPAGRWDVYPSILISDIWMYIFSSLSTSEVRTHRDAIYESLVDLMATDYEFIGSIQFDTASHARVVRRFELVQSRIADILAQEENMCFSGADKAALFKENSQCIFCEKEIAHVDDAAIAGIDKYWLSRTEIPTISFAHRFCNRHKN
jgi:hypothetical protein